MFYKTQEYSGAHITQSITIDVPASENAQIVTAVARVSARPPVAGGGGVRLSLTTQNGGWPHSSDAVATGADGLLAASATTLTRAQAGFGTAVTVRLLPLGNGVEPATIEVRLVVSAQEDAG